MFAKYLRAGKQNTVTATPNELECLVTKYDVMILFTLRRFSGSQSLIKIN